MSTDAAVVRRLEVASRAGCIACVALSALVLVGWALDLPLLKSLHPSLATMKPNTAVCLVLTGTAILLRHPSSARHARWSRGAAVLVLLVGSVTLLEHVSRWNVGLDQALFRDLQPRPGNAPGRMSPVAALDFVLLATAVLMFDVRLRRSGVRPAQWLALLAGLSALLSLVGYAYGVDSLYAVNPYSAIALHTSIALLVISAALLFARPDAGIMRTVVSDSAAGLTARRLLPAALLVPPVLGWMHQRGESAGWYDERFGLALFASASVVGFTYLVWRNANVLLRSEGARKEAEAAVRAEEQKAMQALGRSEGRFRRLAESGIIGIVRSDSAGNIADANDAFLALLGYSREDLRAGRVSGKTVNTPERGRTDQAALIQLEATGSAGPWEKELIRKDGQRVPILIGVAKLEESEGESVAFVLDLTERKRGEAAVREIEARKAEAEVLRAAKDAAEEANTELEAFSYSVAHDLRGPLRAINGFSTIIATDYADKLDDEARQYLSRIAAGAERMSKLIDALLTLSRLTRTELRRERVDLTHLAGKVMDRLREAEPERRVDFAAEEGLVANGDPHLLRALFENLLGNAWKFTGKTSHARIAFGREDVDGTGAYFVRDNGAGFEMARVGKLFSPFQRLHRESDFEGTGIGLATVQRIARRHGGRAWAKGAENEGATFHFTLSNTTK